MAKTSLPSDYLNEMGRKVSAPKTILLLEDDPSVADTVQGILEDAGYAFEWAETADATVERAKADPPALIILDHMLPGSTLGTDVARKLRRTPATRSTPILLLTAINQPYELAVGSGVDAVLPKPFNYVDLVTAVEKLITHEGVAHEH